MLVMSLARSVWRSKVILQSCDSSWRICNIFYSEHPFLQHETLSEIMPRKNSATWMRIFRSFTAKTLEVNCVEKKCPSYFKIKGTSVYLLPQYKPWWGLWQNGLVVSLAGCGAALRPANCHPQDLGICRRSPGNTLSFISLKNRSSVIQKQLFECKPNIIHAACAAAHTYTQHVFVVPLKGNTGFSARNITL